MNIINDIKRTFKEGSVLTRLIYINIGAFLLVFILRFFLNLTGQSFSYTKYFAVSSIPDEFIRKPWTIITYMFYHNRFMHLIFNVLGLYWFGQLFLYRFEGNKLLGVYLLGGISGAVLYIVAYIIYPGFILSGGLLLGASVAVFAILVAVAFYEPDKEILIFLIGRVKLKYVAIFYIVLSIIGISSSNPGGNIAHLGGAFWGWFYILQLRKGKDIGNGLVLTINKLGIFISDAFKSKRKMKVSYKQTPRDDHDYARQQYLQHEELNRILDKIAKSGYGSLTKQEKELLFKQGNK